MAIIWLLSCLVILAWGGEAYPLCRFDETQACLESKEPDCCDFLRYQAHDTACLCLMMHLQLEEYGCYDFDPKLVQCKIHIEDMNCKSYAKPAAYEDSSADEEPADEDSDENTKDDSDENKDDSKEDAHGCPKPEPPKPKKPEPKPGPKPIKPPVCPPPPKHD